MTFLNFTAFMSVLVRGHTQGAQPLLDAHVFQESEQKPCNHPGSLKNKNNKKRSVHPEEKATLSPEEQGEVTAGDGTLRIASGMSDDRQQAPRV